MSRRGGVFFWPVILLALVAGRPARAGEEQEPLFRPGWLLLMAGGAAQIVDGETISDDGSSATESPGSQVVLVQSVGLHLTGQADGPGVGLELQQTFLGTHLRLMAGLRLVWDFALASWVLLRPSIMAGFAWSQMEGEPQGQDPDDRLGLTVQPALGFSLLFGRRLVVTLQPVGFEVVVVQESLLGSWLLTVRYSGLAGVGFVF